MLILRYVIMGLAIVASTSCAKSYHEYEEFETETVRWDDGATFSLEIEPSLEIRTDGRDQYLRHVAPYLLRFRLVAAEEGRVILDSLRTERPGKVQSIGLSRLELPPGTVTPGYVDRIADVVLDFEPQTVHGVLRFESDAVSWARPFAFALLPSRRKVARLQLMERLEGI